MVMAIDVGNSAVKVARVTHGRVGPVTRLATSAGPDTDALARLLVDDPDLVAVVSVVPAWVAAVSQASDRIAVRRLLVASHATVPLAVRLASPATVGADRLLGAWAAREQVGSPCIVVDVGTATTIDVVDADGAFVGGAILPGPALAMRSLAGGTALLPTVPLVAPANAIGRDTVEAMASGVLLGHREAIGGLVARMGDELGTGPRPKVILTGGDADAVDAPDWVDRTEPDLLLWGLGALAERSLAEGSLPDRRVGAGA